MAENSGDLSLGYMMGQSENRNCSGFMGGFGEYLWIIVILAMLGFGGGWGGGFGGGGYMNGALTRAELYDGFALQGIDNGVRGVQQGICDSTFALNNSLKDGFYGVQNRLCDLSHQISDCCCETRQAIANSTREILGYLTNEKIESLRDQNQTLRFRISQADQNAVFRAAIDASTAEIIRRTGNDYPSAAYLVQPPTPINFPTNGCGTVQFGGGYGGHGGYGGYGGGCGCGC